MNAEERIISLIDDYQRRVRTIDDDLENPYIDNDSKIRLTAKRSAYKYFLIELQR